MKFYMSQTYCVAEILNGAIVSSDFTSSFTDVTAQDSCLIHYNHDLLPPLNAGHITRITLHYTFSDSTPPFSFCANCDVPLAKRSDPD